MDINPKIHAYDVDALRFQIFIFFLDLNFSETKSHHFTVNCRLENDETIIMSIQICDVTNCRYMHPWKKTNSQIIWGSEWFMNRIFMTWTQANDKIKIEKKMQKFVLLSNKTNFR